MSDGPPKRRFTVQIQLGADDWDEMSRQVDELLIHLRTHGPNCSSVSGGVASGHWVQVIEDPEMTPEKYRETLELWMQAKEAEKEASEAER